MATETIPIIDQHSCPATECISKTRRAGRALVVRGGKILLTHETHTGVYMTPGGGQEENESLEQCCVRELKEETGYIVNPLKPFLIFNEYYRDTLYVSNYFICEVIGECEQGLTEIEIEHGAHPKWMSVEQALAEFGSYDEKTPDHRSLYLREWTVLNKFIKESGM